NRLCYRVPGTGTVADEVLEALADDLNTPAAIAVLHSLVRDARSRQTGAQFVQAALRLRAALEFLGLYEDQPSVDILRQDVRDRVLDKQVDDLVRARNAARKAKDFKESDRIRDELSAMGIQLKDAKDPATGEIVTTWEVRQGVVTPPHPTPPRGRRSGSTAITTWR